MIFAKIMEMIMLVASLTFLVIIYTKTKKLGFFIPYMSLIMYGIALGVIFITVGIILSKSNKRWLKSVRYLVGKELLRGSLFTLIRLAFCASVSEESYTRLPLVLYYSMIKHQSNNWFSIFNMYGELSHWNE